MTFTLFGFDFYWIDRLFGFWFCSVKIETESNTIHKNLFRIYWSDGEFIIDLFWFRILTAYPFA